MEIQGELGEPVSPIGQLLDCSDIMCLYVFVFLEFEDPIDDMPYLSLAQNTFLTIPRLTSIKVRGRKGMKRWKQIEVKLEDHIIQPALFSHDNMSRELCAQHFNEYVSKIAMDQLPPSKPLWQAHVVKNPINTIILKFHHSLGDGHTLMGILLSCLKRADDPSLPLTFPSLKSSKTTLANQTSLARLLSFISSIFYSTKYFCWSLLKSNWVEDDITPIRSQNEGVEFRPATVFNITFSLQHIKEITSKLGVTVNDVITGIIFYGIRLYMQDIEYESRTKNSTLSTMLSTRDLEGYRTTKEMEKSGGKGRWGNQVTLLHTSIPKLKDALISDPLQFVWKAHHAIHRKKRSFAILLIDKFLRMKHRFQGPEAVAQLFYRAVRNSSLVMSNIVGPRDKMTLGNYPIKGFYFTVFGLPQSIELTMMSYMGMLRVTTRTEQEFIDHRKLASHLNDAFEIIRKAAMEIPANPEF